MSNKPEWEFNVMEASCNYSCNYNSDMITVKRMDDGAGAYFRIETDGFSFNDLTELVELMKDAAKRMGMEDDLSTL